MVFVKGMPLHNETNMYIISTAVDAFGMFICVCVTIRFLSTYTSAGAPLQQP